jgi:molybdopterin synthase sulfur carrier subunit
MLVKFFAYIRDITGCKETDFPYQETLGSLARALCDHYGEGLRQKIFTKDGEALGPDIIIMINGRHVIHLGGLNAPLKEEDTVYVFPMVAGG